MSAPEIVTLGHRTSQFHAPRIHAHKVTNRSRWRSPKERRKSWSPCLFPRVPVHRDLLLDLFLDPLQDRLFVRVLQNACHHALRTLLPPAGTVLEVIASRLAHD